MKLYAYYFKGKQESNKDLVIYADSRVEAEEKFKDFFGFDPVFVKRERF